VLVLYNENMKVKVSSKYQVVIPESVRSALSLSPGTQVEVIAKGGIAYIVPIKSIRELNKNLSSHLKAENFQDLREKKDRIK
jgi:AbrB family looped-hinge helix DNA binding protein